MQTFYAKYGLLTLLAGTTIAFAFLLPRSFMTAFTWRGIFYNTYLVVILALAETIVLAVGEYDFSVVFVFSFLCVLLPGFMFSQHIPWYLACVLVIAIGSGIGALSGFLIHFMQASSFIVTLAVGGIVTGLGEAYSQYSHSPHPPPGISRIYADFANSTPFGIPSPFIVVALLVIGIVILMEFLPAGRYIYALGSNRNHAVLAGVRPGRYLVFVFGLSGAIAGIGAVVYTSLALVGQVEAGIASIQLVFIGAILGTAAIKPGRPNPVGTLIAVSFLGIVTGGLTQLAVSEYVQEVFYGGAFILGVGLAGSSARRVEANKAKKVAEFHQRMRDAPSGIAT